MASTLRPIPLSPAVAIARPAGSVAALQPLIGLLLVVVRLVLLLT